MKMIFDVGLRNNLLMLVKPKKKSKFYILFQNDLYRYVFMNYQ